MEDLWHYLDSSTKEQKGPLPGKVLIRLFEKGLLGINASTLAWKTGLDSWKPLVEIPEFKAVVEFQSKQWYYLDGSEQRGPYLTRFILHKIKEEELDGLSLVFGTGLSEWSKLADVADLREAMRKIGEEEDAIEQAKQNTLTMEQAVFIPDTLDQPSIPIEMLQHAEQMNQEINNEKEDDEEENGNKKKEKSHNELKDKKGGDKGSHNDGDEGFVNSDGIRYRWDDDTQDWIIVEEEDDDEEEEEENDEDNGNEEKSEADQEGDDNDSNSRRKKRKRGNDDNSEVAEGGKGSDKETPETEATTDTKLRKKRKSKNNKRNRKQPATWIYVDGLPANVTYEEVKEHFSKVGLIAISPYDQQPRIKLYMDPENPNLCKGDCTICYNSEESVKLAIDILHEGYIRPNYKLTVTRADFQDQVHTNSNSNTAGPEDPQSKGKKKVSKAVSQAKIKVAKNAMKQALAWNEDDDIGISNKSQALKIVVLEGMFTPQELLADESLIQELEEDIVEECTQQCGPVEKCTIFSKHYAGIIVVKFATAFAAQECIHLMNGRFFGGKKIKSYFWDGATNYSLVGKSEEAEEKEEEHRLEEFGAWLEKDQEQLPEEFRLQNE